MKGITTVKELLKECQKDGIELECYEYGAHYGKSYDNDELTGDEEVITYWQMDAEQYAFTVLANSEFTTKDVESWGICPIMVAEIKGGE